MNKSMFKNITFVLLLGITVFSMIKYVSELKERYRLQDNLVQAQDQIAVLAQEKQNLLQEIGKEKLLREELALKNKGLKDYLKASKERIARLFQSSAKVQNDFEELNAKFSILKAENRSLVDSRQRLYEENEQAKLKLSSIAELKKIIKDLKAKGQDSFELSTEGNQGFLIKDGRSTMKVKIEVVPAQTKK